MIFARADRLAASRGVLRSRLYAAALREYLARHDADSLTEAVNRVVDKTDDGRDDFVRATAHRGLRSTEWQQSRRVTSGGLSCRRRMGPSRDSGDRSSSCSAKPSMQAAGAASSVFP